MTPLKLSVPLPDVLHEIDGDIRVKGHRISLYDIVFAYNEHWVGPHAMVFYYPTLSLDEIQKVLAFYQANQAAVLEYVAECKALEEAAMATMKRLPIEEYRRRFEAMRTKPTGANGVLHPAPDTADTPPAGSVN
jgi:uncharacterized protein (DUF433 family)